MMYASIAASLLSWVIRPPFNDHGPILGGPVVYALFVAILALAVIMLGMADMAVWHWLA